MTATEFLKKQHDEHRALLRRLEAAEDPEERAGLADEAARRLAAHMQIEEEMFYPAIRACSARTETAVAESIEEHVMIGLAVKRVLEGVPEHESLSARCEVLRELTLHHESEEESDLFPEVDRHLSAKRNHALGAALADAFEQLAPFSGDRLLARYPDVRGLDPVQPPARGSERGGGDPLDG